MSLFTTPLPRLGAAPHAQVLQRLYLTMRAQSALGTSIPVTTRHLESLIRLSQARASAYFTPADAIFYPY